MDLDEFQFPGAGKVIVVCAYMYFSALSFNSLVRVR